MLVLAQCTDDGDVYHVLRPLLGYIVAGANVVECKNNHIYGFYKRTHPSQVVSPRQQQQQQATSSNSSIDIHVNLHLSRVFFRPREFNSIYKFYAFITINIRRTTITALLFDSVNRCSIDYMPHLISFACWLNLLHFHSIASCFSHLFECVALWYIFQSDKTWQNRLIYIKLISNI